MSIDVQKNELLEQFQTYLEQQNALVPPLMDKQPDLNTLLSEFIGLKTEVKAESRQFKNTLDTLSSTLVTVQDDNKVLSAELAASNHRFEQQQDEIMQKMLLELIDIYDRLAIGINVLQNYSPIKSVFKKSRKKDITFIKQFEEGQVMTRRRFDQLFQRYQVRAIDCVGKLLDPTTMSAVETASKKNVGNGIVIEELRTGFLYKNQILRLAEVKVNKINER